MGVSFSDRNERRVFMDQLIDFVFDNIFFVILVIGGIMGLFKGKEEEKEKQEQQTKKSHQTQRERQQQAKTSPDRPRTTAVKQTKRYESVQRQAERPEPNISAEEQWARQMQRFAGTLDRKAENKDGHSGMINKEKIADLKREEEVQKLVSKYSHQKFKKQFTSSLTSKGLINSVVMAEVLGAPRARNPYQSVTAKRKKI